MERGGEGWGGVERCRVPGGMERCGKMRCGVVWSGVEWCGQVWGGIYGVMGILEDVMLE